MSKPHVVATYPAWLLIPLAFIVLPFYVVARFIVVCADVHKWLNRK